MNLIMALAGSAACVGGISTLISSCSSACTGVVNLLSTVVFVVASVAAASGWKGLLAKKA